MDRRLFLWLALGVAVVQTGCASSTSSSRQARDATRSVSVSSEVPRPKELFVVSQNNRRSSIDQQWLGDAIQQNRIDVGHIVRAQFISALEAAGVFSIVADGADGEVRLEVRMYGFAHDRFSAAFKPVLGVKATLIGKDGAILWTESKQVVTGHQTPVHTLAEYVRAPELISEALSAASKIAVGALVKSLAE